MDFEALVSNIRHLYENRKQCKVLIKINGDLLTEDDKKKFIEIFSSIADNIYIEHVMSCWPEFEIKNIEVNKQVGIYGQEIKEVLVCPYVFYSFSINSDGTASTCFLDWSRKLIIGDMRTESVKDIWLGKKLSEYQKMFLMKKRKQHNICGNCGQMSHGLPDDIDEFAEKLLQKI
jgi:radical SAM protein with 4Fe4S-binding SPASM domain